MKKLLWLGVFLFTSLVFAQSVVPAAAPWWLGGTISAIEAIPVLGPIVAQIAMWFGIILAIVTAVTKCLQAIVAALSGVAGMAGMDKAQAMLTSFQNSSTFYWLNYMSGFTKPANPAPTKPA